MQAAPSRAPQRRDWLRDYGVYVALALLIVINIVFTPHFMEATNFRIQLVQVSPVLICALGMAMVIGTGGIDLPVGAVMACSRSSRHWR